MITLNTIELPDDLEWPNEFAHEPVGQTVTPTLTGALIIEPQLKPEGRPITLQSNGASWASRALVLQLAALNSTTDPMMLTIHGQSHTVMWHREELSFDAKPIMRFGAPVEHPYYFITLRLLEVCP
ncbi:MAG: hypothetical protein WBH20_14705 [Oceanisphaera sp.]|uniref:hypothetical protein n=1 Tax=Oceanisphaera sp. TaxID=1929979 RepID=UPI003C70CE85